jgi:hypothetical protein
LANDEPIGVGGQIDSWCFKGGRTPTDKIGVGAGVDIIVARPGVHTLTDKIAIAATKQRQITWKQKAKVYIIAMKDSFLAFS